MYEHLDEISQHASECLAELTPASPRLISEMRTSNPNCPEEYFQFLEERGFGGLEEGFMFQFEEGLIDAEKDLFFDREIYKFGAKGPIKIFGSEISGINYGFDSGFDWKLAQVEPNRLVTHLNISFKKFVEGMFVCYPNFPVSFSNGKWRLATGEEYSWPLNKK